MVHNPGDDFNDEIPPLGAAYFATLVETKLAAKDQVMGSYGSRILTSALSPISPASPPGSGLPGGVAESPQLTQTGHLSATHSLDGRTVSARSRNFSTIAT